MRSDLALDALEQALCARPDRDGLTHHSDRGVQYLSIRYTERLADAGIEPSVGTVGDSYDNALAESVIGLYKAEVIRRRDRRATSKPSNSPRSRGSTGSTRVVSSDRLATFLRSSTRTPTTNSRRVRRLQPWRPESRS